LITSTVFGLSGILSGIINSHQRFLLPALASTLYWIGIIIGLIFFVPTMGIFGLAWGAVLGSILHLCIQIPDLFRLPSRHYTPTLGLNNPSVREVVLLMGPRLISVAALQINMIVTSIIASGLPTGSLSAIRYAFPIMTMPLVVIGSGIGFATLPTFSAQFARGQMDDMRSSLSASLRGVLFLSIPATIGLILLREPLIAFLFQHGNFSAESTQMVSWALLWYTAGLVAHCVLEILVRAFFALHDTKTPALVSAGAMGLNIIFSIAFPIWFQEMGWMPLGGLALAITLETAIETTVMFFLLRKRIQVIHARSLLKGTGAALFATLFMAAALLGWTRIAAFHSSALITLGGVLIGGVVYVLILVALRIPEVGSVVRMVKRRFSR
jgi:putative peptidoglycan lipid II flippase